jgi:hypothetical protein
MPSRTDDPPPPEPPYSHIDGRAILGSSPPQADRSAKADRTLAPTAQYLMSNGRE